MNPDSGEVPGIDVRLTAFSSGLQVGLNWLRSILLSHRRPTL